MSISAALQKILYSRLVADAGVGALVGDRIYDRPYKDAAYPYLRFGPSDFSRIPEDDCVQGRLEAFQIDVFSTHPAGLIEARQIVDAITVALDGADDELEAGALVDMRVTAARVLWEPDGVTARGIVTLEAEIQE